MTLALHPLNVLLAVMAAAGLFALVTAIGYQRPVALSETEKLYGAGEAQLTGLQRLQQKLDAARFNINAKEFLRVSIALAVLSGLGAYLLSGAPLAGVLGLVGGGLSYWFYLARKEAKALEAYEDELPQVVARLVSGARLGNALAVAAEHVSRFGPPSCRDDWAYIAEQLNAKADVEQVFRVVSHKRGSQLLNSIFELLLVQQQRGTGLSDVLPLIQETLEERVRTVRRARTRMSGPIRELSIVCATPFAAVILLRFLSPEFARIYEQWTGQLVLIVGWGITLIAFAAAHRSFSTALRRETNFSGALKSEARVPLETTASVPDTPPSGVRAGGAPSALSGLTARPATSTERRPA
jgi:Flp pilus assembly protein TadB